MGVVAPGKKITLGCSILKDNSPYSKFMFPLIIWESFLQVKFFNCDVRNSYFDCTQGKFLNYYVLLSCQVIFFWSVQRSSLIFLFVLPYYVFTIQPMKLYIL